MVPSSTRRRDATRSALSEYLMPALARGREYTDAAPLALAVGSLTLLLLAVLALPEFTRADQLFPDIVNIVVLVAFAVDYTTEGLLARPRPTWLESLVSSASRSPERSSW